MPRSRDPRGIPIYAEIMDAAGCKWVRNLQKIRYVPMWRWAIIRIWLDFQQRRWAREARKSLLVAARDAGLQVTPLPHD